MYKVHTILSNAHADSFQKHETSEAPEMRDKRLQSDTNRSSHQEA